MYTNDSYDDQEECLTEVIYENEVKGIQMRLTVSEFRGNYYIGLRKWVVNLEEDWLPTKQGFSWPYRLETVSTLFSALTGILSKAEVLHEVLENLHYEYEAEPNINDKSHPRFIAGYEAGLIDGKLEKEDE